MNYGGLTLKKIEEAFVPDEDRVFKFTANGRFFFLVHGTGTVDFGDGEKLNFKSGSGDGSASGVKVIHTLEEQAQVTVSGNIRQISFSNGFQITDTNAGVLSIDTPLPATAYSFYGLFARCTSLTSIPEDLFSKCIVNSSSSIESAFEGCTSLTSVPAKLFEKFTEVTWFNRVFYGCTALTSVNETLFKTCVAAKQFNSTFMNSGIVYVGDLFKYCTAVTSFYSTFANTPLSSISGIFDYNALVTSVRDCFKGCSSLSTIPSDVFDTMHESLKNATETFKGCSSAQGDSPSLWSSPYAITSHSGCFNGCTSLSNYADIPSDWK